jgi:hypothetical protein
MDENGNLVFDRDKDHSHMQFFLDPEKHPHHGPQLHHRDHNHPHSPRGQTLDSEHSKLLHKHAEIHHEADEDLKMVHRGESKNANGSLKREMREVIRSEIINDKCILR